MSTSKTAKTTSIYTLMAILLMLVAGMAQAGEKGAYLGVVLQDINTGMAKAMDLDSEEGVLISEVVEGSPAQEAGLQDGDVIIKFNGKKLANHAALTKAVTSSSPGDQVELAILRDGKKKTIEVEFGEREERSFTFFSDSDDVHFSHGDENVFVWQGSERGFMGVELMEISDQMGEYFDVEDGEGALITSVTEDSAAEKAGIKAGDVIIKIDDEDIESADGVHAALAGTEPDQKMEVEVIRKGKKKTMKVTLGEVPEGQMLKQLELIGGDHTVYMKNRKMMHRVAPDPHRMHNEMRIIIEEEDDLKEMREELEKMKMELIKMKSEMKKK